MKTKSTEKRLNIYRVPSLDRALDILDCFSFQTRELNLSEISQLAGLNKTTAKRSVSNLSRRGYFRQDAEPIAQSLGFSIYHSIPIQKF